MALNVNELPPEVLSKIFGYLSLSDRLECRLVCHQWHWAFQISPTHNENVWICFDSSHHDDTDFLANIDLVLLDSRLVESIRKLRLFGLCVDPFAGVRPVETWSDFLKKLQKLSIVNCMSINERDLANLLLHCTSLVSLQLSSARDLMLSGTLLQDDDLRQQLSVSLSKVTEVNLSENSTYLTDLLFNRILSCTPNIQSLILDKCAVLNQMGIYKKFYPNNGSSTMYNSPSVFTFKNVLKFVEEKAQQLKKLSFYHTGIDGLAVQDLGRVHGLDLSHLNIGKCSLVTQEALLDFCQRQTQLEYLKIDYCRRILIDHPATSVLLFDNCLKLKHLSLKCLSVPKGFSDCLSQLNLLHTLDMSQMDVPSKHVADGLLSNGKSLQSLKLYSFMSSEDQMVRIVTICEGLTVLNLCNCQEGVTDDTIVAIVKHMKSLQELYINNCKRATDRGFVKAGCGLNGLQILEVAMLNGLTDLTVRSDAFCFRDLRCIDLTLSLISHEGFALLADQNPHLEQLVAKQCVLLNDNALICVALKCKRLTVLNIEGCQLVTGQSIVTLPQLCRYLKILDVSFCLKVPLRVVDDIRNKMPWLKTVAIRGLEIAQCLADYEEDSPTAPPPPPL